MRKKKTFKMNKNVLKSSIENAFFSTIFQLLIRIVTFFITAFTIRTVNHDMLAIINVRLLLLESTIRFISKEPILKTCIPNIKSPEWPQIINQIWLSVPFPALLGSILTYIWLHWLSAVDNEYFEHYKWACYSVVVSAVIEQTILSANVVAQTYQFIRLKVAYELLYFICRMLVFVAVTISNPSYAILGFAIAQLVSRVFYWCLYYGFFTWYINELQRTTTITNRSEIFEDMSEFPFKSISEFFPNFQKRSMHTSLVQSDLMLLTVSFYKQSAVKQVLTEGERYIMSATTILTFREQTHYDIVNNLGSIPARFIFAPIEDSANYYFTLTINRDAPLSHQDKENVEESAQVLGQLCNLVTSIGMIILVFGQAYSHSFLFLYGGTQLIDHGLSVQLMRCHCLCIILLAVNGMTEGFVFATMTRQQSDSYNYLMVAFSVGYLVSAYFFTRYWGPIGLIIANCVNMLLRIIYRFIINKYTTTPYRPLQTLIPNRKFIFALISSGIVTQYSQTYIEPISILYHIVLGAMCFVGTVYIWLQHNRQDLQLLYDKYQQTKCKQKS